MSVLYIGVCSFGNKSLLQSGFYPKGVLSIANRLQHYSSRFNALELDSPFYALPDRAAVFQWIVDTPADFFFGMRVPSIFTFHRMRWENFPQWLLRTLPKELQGEALRREDLSKEQRRALFEEFINVIEPLHKRKKLGYLLFQFPPWWNFRREHLVYLRRIREQAGPLPLAVEIRHRSWLEEGNRDHFLGLLREENIAYVAVDQPQLAWTIPDECPVTAEWGSVVRFHGRNGAAWEKLGASTAEKSNYYYSEEELLPWRDRLLGMKEKIPKLFLMFNNCVGDNAVKNAAEMRALLQKDGE